MSKTHNQAIKGDARTSRALWRQSPKGKYVRLEEIDDDLKEISFEFFYWFSRFEFALKENKFLKDQNVGAKAEPNWEEFREKFKKEGLPTNQWVEMS